jgi:hypothetical protein
MTRSDALQRAEQCERMAQETSDPHRQEVLRHMRQLWLTMAAHADEFQNVDAEFEQLVALQSAVQETQH